jgi:hypothetical protein
MTKFDDWVRKNGLEHLNGELLRFIHAAWTAADRQARDECAAICDQIAEEFVRPSGTGAATAAACAAKIRETINGH